MIRVYYFKYQRRGCKAVMGEKWFKTWTNAMKSARSLANGSKRQVLVEDFQGRCETVYPN